MERNVPSWSKEVVMSQCRVGHTASSSHPQTHMWIEVMCRASRLRHNPWSVWIASFEPALFPLRCRIYVFWPLWWTRCNEHPEGEISSSIRMGRRRRIFVSDVCIWSLCNRQASRYVRQYVSSIFLNRGIAAFVWELGVPYFPGRRDSIQSRREFRRRRKNCTEWKAFPISPCESHSDRSMHSCRQFTHCSRSTARQSRSWSQASFCSSRICVSTSRRPVCYEARVSLAA